MHKQVSSEGGGCGGRNQSPLTRQQGRKSWCTAELIPFPTMLLSGLQCLEELTRERQTRREVGIPVLAPDPSDHWLAYQPSRSK